MVDFEASRRHWVKKLKKLEASLVDGADTPSELKRQRTMLKRRLTKLNAAEHQARLNTIKVRKASERA